MFTSSATSWRLTALLVRKNVSTARLFSADLALLGLPGLGKFLILSWPCRNCLCHTQTQLLDIVLSPKASFNLRQQLMGVSPDFAKNFKTALWSTLPSIKTRNQNEQKNNRKQTVKLAKNSVRIASALSQTTCTL